MYYIQSYPGKSTGFQFKIQFSLQAEEGVFGMLQIDYAVSMLGISRGVWYVNACRGQHYDSLNSLCMDDLKVSYIKMVNHPVTFMV